MSADVPSSALILARVLRFAPLIVAAAIIAAVASFALAAVRPEQYESLTIVQINKVDLNSLFVDEVLPRPDTYALVASSAALVNTSRVREAASQSLGGTPSADELKHRITVAPEPDATLVRITVTDDDPAGAQAAADAVREAFLEQRSRDAVEQLEGPIRQATTQLARLESSGADADQISTLRKRLDQFKALRSIADAGIWNVQAANRPTEPISPKPARDAVLGGFLGFVLALGAAVAYAYVDRRVRFVAELEELWELPSIAAVPPLKDGTKAGVSEAFALALASGTAQHKPRSIAVVSSVADEGKSHAVIQLAEAAARAGERVLVVDADLRRPSLSRRLSLSTEGGLLDVIAGTRTLADAVQPSAVAQGGGAAPTFDVLVGVAAPNPVGVVKSRAFAQLIASATVDYDLVLIDTPPAVAVADALAIADAAEAVVVVARLGTVPRASFVQLRHLFEQSSNRVIGALAVGGAPATEFDYGSTSNPA